LKRIQNDPIARRLCIIGSRPSHTYKLTDACTGSYREPHAAFRRGEELTTDTHHTSGDIAGRGPRFIVMGAGMAGIHSAIELKEVDLNFVVCEQADRLGGRREIRSDVQG